MKNLCIFIFAQMLLGMSLYAQHQDEVIYTMYRYHPKEAIYKLGIDSCQILEDEGDTLTLTRTIIYDQLGKTTRSIEYKKGYDFIYSYNSDGLLSSTKIWDYDMGEGPTDSFSYNKEGRIKTSYSFWKELNTSGTQYTYKNEHLIKTSSDNYSTVYSYKNGIRTGYKMLKDNKVYSSSKYYYDSSGNLTEIISKNTNDNRTSTFKLEYNLNNLLTQLSVYKLGILKQQYQKTYNEDKLLLKTISLTDIKDGNVDDCDYTVSEYKYFYRE